MGWQRREDCFGNPETLSSQVNLETIFNNRDCWTAAVGCVHDVLNPAVSSDRATASLHRPQRKGEEKRAGELVAHRRCGAISHEYFTVTVPVKVAAGIV